MRPNFGKPIMYALAWILRNTDLKYSKYDSLIVSAFVKSQLPHTFLNM